MYNDRQLAYAAVLGLIVGIAGTLVFIDSTMRQLYKCTTIASLRYRKDYAESIVATAKSRSDAHRGRELYGQAQAAHNSLLSAMSIALGEPHDEKQNNDLSNMWESAEGAFREFYDWYEPPRVVGENAEQMSAGGILGSAVVVLAELAKAQENRGSNQLAEIREEMDECKWRAWNDI